MDTIYTHKMDWVTDNYRLPYVGETVTVTKSLGWSNDPDQIKTVVCYSSSDRVPHTLERGRGDYWFQTVDIINNPGSNVHRVVNVHNSGYTKVLPGMKSQEVLTQFI